MLQKLISILPTLIFFFIFFHMLGHFIQLQLGLYIKKIFFYLVLL